KMIPAHICEIDNVGFCDCSFMGDNGVAYAQLLEVFPEWMLFIFMHSSARVVSICNRRNKCRRTLYRYPLHVMFNTSYTTHFFSAASSSRASMHKGGKRRTMSGTFLRTFIV